MNGGDLPSHLSGGPELDDSEYLFSDRTIEEIGDTHTLIASLTETLSGLTNPENTRYFIIGSYKERPMKRLRTAQTVLPKKNQDAVAVLLSDLNVEDDGYHNFYIKFRVVEALTDYAVLIAEDNDGGHELELGELSLESTYVAKRDYEHASIDHDLERQKYDAMIAKLFEVLEVNDQLFTWTSIDEFNDALSEIASRTDDLPTRLASRSRTDFSIDLPDDWIVHSDRPKDYTEYNPMHQPLIEAEHESEGVWIAVERRNPLEGRPRDIPQYVFKSGLNARSGKDVDEADAPCIFAPKQENDYEIARTAVRFFTHQFSKKLKEGNDPVDAYEYAREQVDDQYNLQ
ncbi:hypothetical protein ACFQE1_01535 [Halobium palmae]|uniref:Uncharacterized protein n=1 Tax=Halobium palmae TaxID=1776492 RepID=A0ABD5RVU9_9EURY